MKEDLRIIKTKRALYEAFVSLLSEKSFEELTVNELCDRADVRRATFYTHYADKLHFLTCFTRGLADGFNDGFFSSDPPETAPEYYTEYILRIIEFLETHDALVQNLIKSDLFPAVISMITEQNYRHTRERLEARVAAGRNLNYSPEVTASMLNGGAATSLYMWLLEGKKKSPAELASEISRMISTALEG